MKYKCLVLDHDDTIVNSTPTVNFPAFKKCLAKLRPDVNLELEEYICYNFEPGLNRYYKEILNFSDDEIQYQFNNWIGYVMEHTPSAFDGIREILWKFKENRRTHLCCITFHEQKYN